MWSRWTLVVFRCTLGHRTGHLCGFSRQLCVVHFKRNALGAMAGKDKAQMQAGLSGLFSMEEAQLTPSLAYENLCIFARRWGKKYLGLNRLAAPRNVAYFIYLNFPQRADDLFPQSGGAAQPRIQVHTQNSWGDALGRFRALPSGGGSFRENSGLLRQKDPQLPRVETELKYRSPLKQKTQITNLPVGAGSNREKNGEILHSFFWI